MRALHYLIFLLVLGGCSTLIATHQLDERLGPPDPARYDKASLALLRPPTLCDGQAAQRGKQTGVPLCQTAQRAHQ
jgi:hypothetical protein